jgi:hypothetical protein
MLVVVPYNSEKPWPFKECNILFHYQVLSFDEVTVYFPSTRGSNILKNVPSSILEDAIREYVQTHILAFVDNVGEQDVLRIFFVDAPVFDILYTGALHTGKVTIDVPWAKNS